jgi:16S rRNA processing protein RimM
LLSGRDGTDGQERKVEVGKIVAPHGVRGEVRVIRLSEFTEQVNGTPRFYVDGRGWLAVESRRFHKQFILLKFTGVNDLDAAGELKGRLLFLSRGQIGDLPAGRYYIEDLIGLEVLDLSGAPLGQLTEVLPTGGNDVYVVKMAGRKDLLLPALKTVVRETDLSGRRMVVAPPLWEKD